MWFLRALIALGVALSAWRTCAQEAPAIAIAWIVESSEAESDAAESCEKPANMDAEVLQLAPRIPSGAAARFEVRLQALSEGRYLLRVSSAAAPVARARELGSCQEAREAAALIVAMALGLEASPSSSVAAASEPEAAKAQHSRIAELGVPTRVTFTILALLDLGTLPGVGVGPALDLGLASGLLRLGLSAHYLPARTAPGVPAGAKIRLDSYALTLHGAALFRFGRTAFGPRAELELGALRGVPRGLEDGKTLTAWRTALLGGLELELWLHPRIGLQLTVQAGSPLGRPRFALADNAAEYTTSALIVRAALGMTVWIDPTD